MPEWPPLRSGRPFISRLKSLEFSDRFYKSSFHMRPTSLGYFRSDSFIYDLAQEINSTGRKQLFEMSRSKYRIRFKLGFEEILSG
jgi:hypothetical protein